MWGCLSQTLADRSTDEQADNGAVTVLAIPLVVLLYILSQREGRSHRPYPLLSWTARLCD